VGEFLKLLFEAGILS